MNNHPNTNIDLSKEYTVDINDFLSQGGDGYDMFKKSVVGEIGTYEEVFADYLNVNGTKNCEVSGRVSVGQKVIILPVQTVSEPTVSAPEVTVVEKIYIVKSGDNLYRIGVNNNIDWLKLASYNNIANPRLIYPGQVIKIPA